MRMRDVEDEAKPSQYLHKGLSENGHVVDLAPDGIDGRHPAIGGEYDLVLLDVMLPGIDGFGALAAMRQQGRKAPVLMQMLAARDKAEGRVRGLEGGAVDYRVKPFAFSDLLSRVGVLLRRGAAAGTPHTATLIGQTELALSLERSAESLREALVSNLKKMQRLSSMVSDMLFLSSTDRGAKARRGWPAAGRGG